MSSLEAAGKTSAARWRRVSLTLTLVAALGGCAATRPDGVEGCGDHFYPYLPASHYVGDERFVFSPTGPDFAQSPVPFENGVLTAVNGVPPRRPNYFNILVLSGGGQWGAYGAGFLKGWSEADKTAPNEAWYVKREEIDLQTGVSTGAMQTTMAYAGATTVAINGVPAEQYRKHADDRLEAEYRREDVADLIERRGLLSLPFSNSIYRADGLETAVRDGVQAFYLAYTDMPDRQRPYVGLVDLDRDTFYVADLKALAKANNLSVDKRKECLTQTILGSAAIPIGLPPRFIDHRMFVDGGARFGMFASIMLNNKKISDRIKARSLIPYLHVIVNGNLANNTYAPNGPKDVENGLLPIAGKTAANVTDQLYKDSAYRTEQDLKRVFDKDYRSRYTYIANKDIAASDFPACRASQGTQKEDIFDHTFMECLYHLGYCRGHLQMWQEWNDVPHLISNPTQGVIPAECRAGSF
jgi:predicted acylesterase/phospholipase RssA